MDSDLLKAMLDVSQQNKSSSTSQFTPEEASRFKKAFDDPEFRRMFSEYMDELQDPSHRQETEAYISQLEEEQKVPEGKELIRPQPGFVAKTYKVSEGGKETKEKIFLNIVQSEKIATPSKTATPRGDCWSVPYSVGPPHMERDKKGENSACFDCCFHPDALALSTTSAEFRSLLVTTAMDGVEALYQRQQQNVKLDRDFHVVKGVKYKEGQVPSMLIATANKAAWKEKEKETSEKKEKAVSVPSSSSSKTGSKTATPTAPAQETEAEKEKKASPAVSSSASSAAPPSPSPSLKDNTPKKKTSSPAIKRGFLNSSKSSLYPDKIPTIRPKTAAPAAAAAPLSEEEQKQKVDSFITEMEKAMVAEAAQHDKPKEIATRSAENVREAKDALKPVATKMKTKEEVSSAATEVSAAKKAVAPEVVCKHREAVSMGDFQAMKAQQVASRRPEVLVYDIHLPLVTSAAKVSLDVSERKLRLTYLDVYELDMDLPFKVLEKKGSASFDKAKKVLKVTLPVEPSETVSLSKTDSADTASLSSPVRAPSVHKTTTGSGALVQELSSSEASSVSPSLSSAAQTTSPVKHSRWVSSSDNKQQAKETESESSAALSESERLFREVQEQAELAKKKFIEEKEKEKEKAPRENVSSPVKREKMTEKEREKESLPADAKPFLPSSSFQGARRGYVFKKGDLGLGYYLDTAIMRGNDNNNDKSDDNKAKATSQEKEKEAEAAPVPSHTQEKEKKVEEKTEPLRSIPYRVQQNEETIALLLQVPRIIASSVQISLQEFFFSVRFDAISDEGDKAVVSHGMRFSLDASLCPEGVSTERCKHDVASKNMVLVLRKKNPQASWSDEDAEKWLSAEEMTQSVPSTATATPTDSSSQQTEAKKKTTATPTPPNPTAAMKSILSTMKFSTDFVSELD